MALKTLQDALQVIIVVLPMHKGVSTLASIYRLVTDYFMMFSNPFSLILTSVSGVEPPEIRNISKERRY